MGEYLIKKWKALDRAGNHPQFAASFNGINIGGQNPKQSLADIKKVVQNHHDYETFQEFKRKGKPLEVRFSKAKYRIEVLK